MTINSGGEKIFAEEVEQALSHHPAVLRRGRVRPPERAVGQRGRGRGAAAPTAWRRRRRDLAAEREQHIARYKLPKAGCSSTAVERRPSGKADYRWAKELATGTTD